jgi:hypothetical protein
MQIGGARIHRSSRSSLGPDGQQAASRGLRGDGEGDGDSYGVHQLPDMTIMSSILMVSP